MSAFNDSNTLFIRLEFDVNAACAVLSVVSTPKETTTLSGFVWFDAEPDTNSVLFVRSVWARTLVKLCSIAVRIAMERITIAVVSARFALLLLWKYYIQSINSQRNKRFEKLN